MTNIRRIISAAALTAFATMAATALFTSCQQELAPAEDTPSTVGETVPVTLTASFEESKMNYAEEGTDLQPSWEVGDLVHAYKTDGAHYTFTVKEVNDGVATLKGEASDGTFRLVFNGSGTKVSYDGQKGDKRMPAVMFSEGTISGMAGTFTFRNAGAVIGITNAKGLPAGAEIGAVTVTGENLSSGTITLGSLVTPSSLAADAKTGDAISTAALSDVTVGSGEDRALSSPIYIAVAPGAKVSGVSLNTGARTYTYSLASVKEAHVNDYLYVKGQFFRKDRGELLDGKFSVSPTEYVQFSRGNLYCTDNGSGTSPRYVFSFEENQYDFRCRNGVANDQAKINGVLTSTPPSTSGQFQWLTSNSGASEYDLACYGAFSELTKEGARGLPSDVLNYGLCMGTGSEWYTLTRSEYDYLINSRQNADKLRKWCNVLGMNGLLLAPDVENTLSAAPDYLKDYATWEAWEEAAATYDLVFLPATGYLCYYNDGDPGDELGVNGLGAVGYYYSSSSKPNDDDFKYLAYYLDFYSAKTETGSFNRNYGRSVRLVQKRAWPDVQPDFIDLDLPSGTLWADVNLGATSKTGPRSLGKFYAWGETETKMAFTLENYKFTSSFTKYNGADGLTVLQLADDAAHVLDSRTNIPTREQYEELINGTYTTNAWTDDYNGTGVAGLIVTSNSNGNHIFLPAAGLQNGETPALIGTNGCYWSSTLNPTPDPGEGTAFPACAIDLDFVKDNVTPPFVYKDNDDSQRFAGQSVRAVKQGPIPMPWVDLGLESGTLWCETNLNASSATEYGLYYQFGSTTGHNNSQAASYSTWSTAPFNGGSSSWNETVWNAQKALAIGSDGNLKLEYDAAYQQTYGAARMPTRAQIEELIALTNEWTDNYNGTGVHGRVFHGTNGNTLFIPAAGCYYDGNEHYVGNNGVLFWSSTLNGDQNAYYMHSWDISPSAFVDNKPRYYSYPIRPVKVFIIVP